MCLVPGCPERHKYHYCRCCGNKNSPHFRRDCPYNTLCCQNAAIMVIGGSRRTLMVRDRNGKEWTLPGGKVNRGETTWDAALRELREETGFFLDPYQITKKWSIIIDHSNGQRTEIFLVWSNQRFGNFVPNNETDMHHFIQVEHLKSIVHNGTQHGTVKVIKGYNISSFKKIFRSGILG